MSQQVNKRKKADPPVVMYNADDVKPMPKTRDVDEEIECLYGSLDSIPSLLKAILKELVRARLTRG
jgi:hypothetical protein